MGMLNKEFLETENNTKRNYRSRVNSAAKTAYKQNLSKEEKHKLEQKEQHLTQTCETFRKSIFVPTEEAKLIGPVGWASIFLWPAKQLGYPLNL